MDTADLADTADAKAHLSELLDRFDAGALIDITRRSKLAARVVAANESRWRTDGVRVYALTASITPQTKKSIDLVKLMLASDCSLCNNIISEQPSKARAA